MDSQKNHELSMKYSNWAVQVVADQTGKSPFESMTPLQFSEFLYTLMRYKNKSLFSELATILEPSFTLISEFWKAVFYENPRYAINTVLDCNFLLKTPNGWTKENFNEFLDERLSEFEKRGGKDSKKEYGRPLVSSYLIHVRTQYFEDSLKDQNLSAEEWSEILSDWQDAVDGMRSRDHYLRNRVLRKIIEAGLRVQLQIVEKIHSLGEHYEDASNVLMKDNPVLFKLCHSARYHILHVIEIIFDYNWHAFSVKECVFLSERFYSNQIFLQKDDPRSCKGLGEKFFYYAFWFLQKGTWNNFPECLRAAGGFWAEEKRKEGLKRYSK